MEHRMQNRFVSAFPGTDLEIISVVTGFLAALCNEHTHLRLVGAFVLAESDIPVNPPSAVLWGKGAYAVIKSADSCNQLHSKLFHFGFGFQVALFVRLKPGLVVVFRKFLKKLQYLFHGVSASSHSI